MTTDVEATTTDLRDSDPDLRDVIQFHGHLCPGLALGYRVAKAALRELKTDRPHDEELVAVVENDSCAVDAIQFVTGCTFGKGNLVFRDHGKHVYTFFNRKDRTGSPHIRGLSGLRGRRAFHAGSGNGNKRARTCPGKRKPTSWKRRQPS